MSACIYGIKNKVNSKYYIGQTINLPGRKSRHIRLLRKNEHHSKYLQNSWNKYGEENFTFEIIEEGLSLEDVKERETYWIQKIGNYNMDKNGRNPYTKEAIQNMSDAHIGNRSPSRLLSDQEVKYCLAINEFMGECERPLSKLFNCNRIVFRNLFHGKGYRDIVEQYNQLDLEDRLSLLEKGISKINYNIYPTQGGELYGVLIHYLVFDLNLSNKEAAQIVKKSVRTIERVIAGEVLPKSKEIYSKYNKDILKRVSLLYYN